MEAEHPRYEAYHDLQTKTEDLAYLASHSDRPDHLSLLRVVMAAIHAFESGNTPQDIAQAVGDGTGWGVTFYEHVINNGRDLAYWRSVRDEAENHWHSQSPGGQ